MPTHMPSPLNASPDLGAILAYNPVLGKAIEMPVLTSFQVLGGIIAGSQLSRLYPAASLLPPVGNFAFIESSLTNSFIWGVGVGSEGYKLTSSSFLDWFMAWSFGVSQSMGQWKSSSWHGIPKPRTIFATAGHSKMSWVLNGFLVKMAPLCSGDLENIMLGLFFCTGSGSSD